MTDAASRAIHENDTPPDLSQGYTPGGAVRCPFKYTQIISPTVTKVYHCELERRHSGNHRQDGAHWEGHGLGFGVDPDATIEGETT